MDKTETIKILAILKVAYPNSYKDTDMAQQAVALWNDMFSDVPAKYVAVAVKSLIAVSKFPPTIAEVSEYIQKLARPDRIGAEQAWELIRKALNGPDARYTERGWDYSQAYGKLPAEVKQTLGNPSQLRIYGDMSESELEQFERPRFIRYFTDRQQEQEKYDRLPASVKKQTEQLKSVPLEKLLAEAHKHLAEKKS